MDAAYAGDSFGVKAVVIGGGTGSFTLLSALKHYTQTITALVNMADDGGSTGQLRDELGVLPPGDVRQCLVALSRSSDTMRELFNYRFPEGTLAGHSFGNLFLTAVEKMTDNFGQAVELASTVLNITGTVIPMTTDKVTLVVEHADKTVMRGESVIDHADFGAQTRPLVRLEPQAAISPAAKQAIIDADIIVIAPGDLYSSIGPALAVGGVAEALSMSAAKKVYVCNLVTKPGQTDGFAVHDFADEIERLMGGQNRLDYVLYNNAKPDEALLKKYAHDNEFWVGSDDAQLVAAPYEAIGGDFVSKHFATTSAADPLAASRSFIRHDADKVSRALMKIYFS
jgi:uncharacterized cofD-like protein